MALPEGTRYRRMLLIGKDELGQDTGCMTCNVRVRMRKVEKGKEEIDR